MKKNLLKLKFWLKAQRVKKQSDIYKYKLENTVDRVVWFQKASS